MPYPAAVAIIKHYEGCKLTAYQDGKAKWTIGYGHAGPDVTPGLMWTLKQAEEALIADMAIAEKIVKDNVKVPLNDNQISALMSFAYNVGRLDFARSGMLKVLNKGDYKGAMEHLLLWNHIGSYLSQGLTNRRKAEKALFLTPMESK